MKSIYTYLFIICFTLNLHAAPVDLLIFSYNRPMQLFALLESIETYMTGLDQVWVLYRADDDRYEAGYGQVKETFPQVTYMQQTMQPNNFKSLTIRWLRNTQSPYIMFAVDDIIVKDEVDCEYCTELMQQTGAYGFYLRLGKNTTYCYPLSSMHRVPPLELVCDDVYSFLPSQGSGDWYYPHTVDMTMYKKDEVRKDFYQMNYHNPNSLEGNWTGRARRAIQSKSLCFGLSKIVNLPLNRVQNTCRNRTMNFMTPLELLELFEQDYRIDIAPLYQIKNKSAHMNYEPSFI